MQQQHQPVPFQPYSHHGNSHGGSPVLGSTSSLASSDGYPPRLRNPMSNQASPVPAYENVRWGDTSPDKPPPLPPRSYPHSVYPPPPPPPLMLDPQQGGYHSQQPPGYSPHDPLAQVYPDAVLGSGGYYPPYACSCCVASPSSSPTTTNRLCKSYSCPSANHSTKFFQKKFQPVSSSSFSAFDVSLI